MKTIPFIDLKAQYQALREPINKQIQTVLEHGQFIMGPEVEELERRLAKFTGVKHAIACSSGTDAAILAMMAMGIGPGDEVIVPAFSFIATAETVHLVGATPVYVDVDSKSCNLDTRTLEKALSKKTKAIQPVSLYGQPADMDEINAFAKKHGLTVIEDGAQSFGAMYKGKRSCALSEAGVTSFFPAKPLGCFGDGGAAFTDDDKLAEAMKEIRVHGQKQRYYHTRIGINGRLDTLQCAILIPKLERFPWELEQRTHRAMRFNQAFGELESRGVIIPRLSADRSSSWAQYTLQVPEREKFQKAMQEKGIPTAVHYPRTMPDQPAYTDQGRTLNIEVSRKLAETVVSLPLYPDMTDDIQSYIVDTVRTYFVKGA
jgi:UDP-2-acetamido-2-deoxy-ribo-hexuluronate aminotransferase